MSHPVSRPKAASRSLLRTLPVGWLAFTASLGVLACGDGSSDPEDPAAEPTDLTRVSGPAGTAFPGDTLADSLVVRVVDAADRGVPGLSVAFDVVRGGGRLSAYLVETGPVGRAATQWIVGDAVGPQRVEASASGLQGSPIDFEMLVELRPGTGIAATLEYVRGSNQRDTAGYLLPQPIHVRVVDRWGNPVPDVEVEFVVTAGGGALIWPLRTTNADGEAATEWRIRDLGENFAEARSEGLAGSPVVFRAVGIEGRVAEVVLEPDSTRIESLSAEAEFVGSVFDDFGNPAFADPADAPWAWEVRDPGVAVLSRGGWNRRAVEAAAEGRTFLLAYSEGQVDSSLVVVEQRVYELVVSPPAGSVALGTDTARIGVTPEDRTDHVVEDARLTWTSSDPSVATVTDSGEVRGASHGTAVIRIEEQEGATAEVPVDVVDPFTAVSAGVDRSCGLDDRGRTWCWGGPGLGNGLNEPSERPVMVDGGHDFASVSAGSGVSCGLEPGGAAYCWGIDFTGALGVDTSTIGYCDVGSGTRTRCALRPKRVSGGHTFETLAAGGGTTCAAGGGGAGYCWGSNSYGQLGDGTTNGARTPVAVAGGYAFVEISPGWGHTCGVTSAGKAYCWGLNAWGQVGVEPSNALCRYRSQDVDCRLEPELVAGGLTFSTVGTGKRHSCGLGTDGVAYCWGFNGGDQLGRSGSGPVPIPIDGDHRFVDISVGGDHACGMQSSGAALCWGFWADGQLGAGTAGASGRAVPVVNLSNIDGVDAGDAHTCAVSVEGAVYCWGSDVAGQLGNPAYGNTAFPMRIRGPA